MTAIAIIDSGVANTTSVALAVRRAGGAASITRDPDQVRSAAGVILPGVGSAGAAMARLKDYDLVEVIRGLERPILGICLGMQLMFEGSEEGNSDCLGLIPGRIRRMPPSPGLRIPHMGWNRLILTREDDPLFEGVMPGDHVYFVHSFAADVGEVTIAESEHGVSFSAAVRQKNFWGCQFHPERSGPMGAQIIANFLEIARCW